MSELKFETDLQKRCYEGAQDFTGRELSNLTEMEIYREEGENRRWYRAVEVIIQIHDKYFSISYDEGLTENQESEFDSQPVEVERIEETKTITVVHWPIKKK